MSPNGQGAHHHRSGLAVPEDDGRPVNHLLPAR
jgi:hypothetical protein